VIKLDVRKTDGYRNFKLYAGKEPGVERNLRWFNSESHARSHTCTPEMRKSWAKMTDERTNVWS